MQLAKNALITNESHQKGSRNYTANNDDLTGMDVEGTLAQAMGGWKSHDNMVEVTPNQTQIPLVEGSLNEKVMNTK